MLPSHWRLQVENNTGVSIDAEIKFQGHEIDETTLEQAFASWSADLGFTGLADGAFDDTGDIDNSTNGYHAATIEVAITAASAPSGKVKVYFQRRGDGASDWPDDGEGWPALVFDLSATGTFRKTQVVS